MTQNQNPNQPLQTALDQARALTGTAQTQALTNPNWVAQARHVGDLSILALALRS
jgi:hypothetical protein